MVSILLTRRSTNFVPWMILRGPANQWVTDALPPTGGANDSAFIGALRLTHTGTHNIRVSDAHGRSGFPFSLTLFQCPATNVTDAGDGSFTLLPHTPRDATSAAGDLDPFTFPAVAGDSLWVDLQNVNSERAPKVLELFGPDCTLLGSATGLVFITLRLPLCPAPQTGNYTVLVRSATGSEPFTYTLTLGQNPAVPRSQGANQHLSILQCSSHVIVRWETNSAGFILESATNLDAASWLPVNRVPIVLGDYYYLDEGEVSNVSNFYRLRCSNCGASAAASRTLSTMRCAGAAARGIKWAGARGVAQIPKHPKNLQKRREGRLGWCDSCGKNERNRVSECVAASRKSAALIPRAILRHSAEMPATKNHRVAWTYLTFLHNGKAAEDCRSPRRWRVDGCSTNWRSFWTAAVLCRFWPGFAIKGCDRVASQFIGKHCVISKFWETNR